jgi:hypothetical protein
MMWGCEQCGAPTFVMLIIPTQGIMQEAPGNVGLRVAWSICGQVWGCKRGGPRGLLRAHVGLLENHSLLHIPADDGGPRAWAAGNVGPRAWGSRWELSFLLPADLNMTS